MLMLKAGMGHGHQRHPGHLSRMSREGWGQHIHGAKILCFEIWDAVGLDCITSYTEPVPISGTPAGLQAYEDIRGHLRTTSRTSCPAMCRYRWTMTRRRRRPRP